MSSGTKFFYADSIYLNELYFPSFSLRLFEIFEAELENVLMTFVVEPVDSLSFKKYRYRF